MQTGKFTVTEVEDRTHVPGGTLRQWERRYGFPNPTRLANGYRLYSEVDVLLIERMKQLIADGIPASRAAALVRESSNELVGPSSQASPLDVDSLLRALKALDGLEVERILGRAHAGAGVVDVFTQLLEPVVEVLAGAASQQDPREPAMRHLIELHLHNLLAAAPHNGGSPLIDVWATVPDSRATRALMLLVLLRRRGLSVRYLGAGHDANSMERAIGTLPSSRVHIVVSDADGVSAAAGAFRESKAATLILAAGSAESAGLRSSLPSADVYTTLKDTIDAAVEAVRTSGVPA